MKKIYYRRGKVLYNQISNSIWNFYNMQWDYLNDEIINKLYGYETCESINWDYSVDANKICHNEDGLKSLDVLICDLNKQSIMDISSDLAGFCKIVNIKVYKKYTLDYKINYIL